MKRLFDLLAATVGLVILSPFLFAVALLVAIDSGFPVFFIQKRVGRAGEEFGLYKFKTMYSGSEKRGQLTVGEKDSRVTRIGYYLRKYKLDELPQLLNVWKGEMSVVGPRPEVKQYVDLYSEDQLKVLSVRPGITDYASIQYFEENRLLGEATDPEKTYIEEIMPAKLALNQKYIEEMGFWTDLKIIFSTLAKIF